MQISVTLRVSGDLLVPEEITSILNVIPHVAKSKGESRTSSSGKEIVAKFGFWSWKSENIGVALTVNDHINQIKITFEHAYPLLDNLPNAENAWIDVCIVKNEEENLRGDGRAAAPGNQNRRQHRPQLANQQVRRECYSV